MHNDNGIQRLCCRERSNFPLSVEICSQMYSRVFCGLTIPVNELQCLLAYDWVAMIHGLAWVVWNGCSPLYLSPSP